MAFEIVCVSTADWDAELWTNKQQLMSRLAAQKIPVLYVDSTGLRSPGINKRDFLRIFHKLRRWRLTALKVADNMYRDSPLVIPLAHARMEKLNSKLLSFRMSRNLKKLSFTRPFLWTYSPVAASLIDEFKFRAVIYHCVDDLAAYPGVDSKHFNYLEEDLIRKADVCIASSRVLFEKLKRGGARRVLYWPNPADVSAFTAARMQRSIPSRNNSPRIGFVGAIQDHKVDVELVKEIARRRENWDIYMVGPLDNGMSTSSVTREEWPKNVTLAGVVSRHELPALVSSFDIGLIPYKRNRYTASVFPLKVFEYLGAGLPVVSTSLESLVGEVDFVSFADSADEMIESIDRLLSEEKLDIHKFKERLSYARGHSWESRVSEVKDLLAEFE